MTRLKIAGFEDARNIAEMLSSNLIDVVYVDEVTPDAVYLISDEEIKFEKPDDFEWVKGLIMDVAVEHDMKIQEITIQQQ